MMVCEEFSPRPDVASSWCKTKPGERTRYLFLGNAGPVVGQSCAEVSQQVYAISGHHPQSIILPSHAQNTTTTHSAPTSSDSLQDMYAGEPAPATASAHVFLVFLDIAVASAVLASLHQHAAATTAAGGLQHKCENPDYATEVASAAAAAVAASMTHGTEERNFGAAGSNGKVLPISTGDSEAHSLPAFEATNTHSVPSGLIDRCDSTQVASCRNLIAKFAALKVDKSPRQLPASTSSQCLGVPGLLLIPDFVTESEEVALLEAIEGGQWTSLAKRRVQHYGHIFDYTARHVGEHLGPLPPWVTAVAGRVQAVTDSEFQSHSNEHRDADVAPRIDQMTVNEYTPGVGLSAHIDTHSAFSGAICSLSLGGSVVMEMRSGDTSKPLLLPPRSLLMMAGESRYAWQHYIPHRKSDLLENGTTLARETKRVSLTFRSVRTPDIPCTCPYPTHCDSQASLLPPTRLALLQLQQQLQSQPPAAQSYAESSATADPGSTTLPNQQEAYVAAVAADSSAQVASGCSLDTQQQQQRQDQADRSAAKLEVEHVHKVYDAIAPHFSSTRFAIWPRVRDFIMSLPAGAVVADVGCGNGKYFGVRQDLAVVGSDRSIGLAKLAMQRLLPGSGESRCSNADKADVMLADALSLPFRPDSLDAVLNIAVLHHISTNSRRLRMLQQLMQILRPGGKALITVWAAEQEEPKRTLAKWTRISSTDTTASNSSTQPPIAPTAEPPDQDNSRQLLEQQQQQQQQQQSLKLLTQEQQQHKLACESVHDSSPADSQTAQHVGQAQQQQTEEQRNSATLPPAGSITEGCCAADLSTPPPVEVAVSVAAQRQLDGGDFFVPWHLPLHRAETRKAVQAVVAAAGAASAISSTAATVPTRTATTTDTAAAADPTAEIPGSNPAAHRNISTAGLASLVVVGTDPRVHHVKQTSDSSDDVCVATDGKLTKSACEASAALAGDSCVTVAVAAEAVVTVATAATATAQGPGAAVVAVAVSGAPVLSDAKSAVVFQRYYHLFEAGELVALAQQMGPGVRVIDEFFDRSNWCVVLQRI